VTKYVKKELENNGHGVTATTADGTFIQKEKFKFKDFQSETQNQLMRKRKEQEKKERVRMEGLIAAHIYKQKTKMDFKTYF